MLKIKRKIQWWHVLIIAVGSMLFLMFTAPWWNPIVFPPIKNPTIGVSFSDKRSRELGLDWRANYTALLDDMHIRSFRLMSYWDEYEKNRGQFDFTDLDWQMDEAAKRGATVSLSIGLRQPRWPECHEPGWATTLSGNEWKQSLYAYIKVVMQRYENHPALLSWQLENEGANNWFGTCGPVDKVRLTEEFNFTKSLTAKPVWMSLSDQHGLPINPPLPDKFGYSVYRTVWSDKTWPYIGYMTYPTPIWYHKLRAVIIKAYTGRDIFIHEMQLEPWAYRDTKDVSIAEQDKSMNLDQIHDNLLFTREIGAQDIYAWGSEWWYWRKEILKDPTVWEKVRSEISTFQ
ncbi:hypothetical protein H7Y40_02665 [Pedobacter sp.]|nr:hypothetical protein [Candidatus Saccharibacteria bacterium]